MGVLLVFDSLRFCMLKTWIANPNLDDIEIEEKYKKYTEEQRKDKYTTAPRLKPLCATTISYLERSTY